MYVLYKCMQALATYSNHIKIIAMIMIMIMIMIIIIIIYSMYDYCKG